MNAQLKTLLLVFIHHSQFHLEEDNKEIYDQFVDIAERLENHFRDMQDLEFTIERGKLYMLQTRMAKELRLQRLILQLI